MYRDVETKTFKMLKQQLPESEAGGAAPSSLWDRSMDDRSDYLKATGPTYQKAYGEKWILAVPEKSAATNNYKMYTIYWHFDTIFIFEY